MYDGAATTLKAKRIVITRIFVEHGIYLAKTKKPTSLTDANETRFNSNYLNYSLALSVTEPSTKPCTIYFKLCYNTFISLFKNLFGFFFILKSLKNLYIATNFSQHSVPPTLRNRKSVYGEKHIACANNNIYVYNKRCSIYEGCTRVK